MTALAIAVLATAGERAQRRARAMFGAPWRNYYPTHMGTELSLALAPPPRAEEAAGTYLQAIARYRWVVLGSVLLAVLIGLVTLARGGHSYEASASILVSPLSQDSTLSGTGVLIDTGDPARTVQTAAALLDTRRASIMAAKAMGRGWDAADVEDAVTVAPRGQSNVLAVTARAPTAAEASKLATAFAISAVASRAQVIQRNVRAKLRALNAQLRAAAATPAERQELAVRIVQFGSVRGTGDPTLQVAQQAQEPTSAVGFPKWIILFLCALVGFAIGSIGAVALSYFSPRVGDAREVAALLPAPVLADIPKVSYRQRRNGLTPTSMPPFAFEQFRKLRVQIPNSDQSSTIMVTSADPGDGKTTVAASLAAAFAEGSDEIILLDLNIRRPGVADVFGLEPTTDPMLVGSADLKRKPSDPMLVGSANLKRMLVSAPGFPRLKVLSARQATIVAFERLVSQLPDLLDEARDLAKWIILDTPPISEVGDALRFVSECDGVMLVVRPGHTDRYRLIDVYNQLARSSAPLIGTVINAERQVVTTRTVPEYHRVAFESDDTSQDRSDRTRWAPRPADSSVSGTAHAE